jgi:hypothetical protein
LHHDVARPSIEATPSREGDDGADVGLAGAGIEAGDGFLDLVDRVARCVSSKAG